MARALNSEEAEVFKDAISPERQFTAECGGSLEGLLQRRDEELELTTESAFWFGGCLPGATKS
jgi:hypothetical protein